MLLGDISFNGYHTIQEARHLTGAVAHQYRLKIITIQQTLTDAGGNGINIF
ncbi:hypothetical protein SDC9_196858 [bioreactor metagenome]|uniref:Uncharacterized protein n=1 Tax=bioreactor metagenome TaxID=1076179 RepID=A0A645IPR9_9ZZZZ